MIDDRRPFSDRLIDCESLSPALRQEHRKEIIAMFDKKLGPVGRAICAFWAVLGLAQTVFLGYMAVTTYGKLPIWGTLGSVVGIVFALAFGSLFCWIAYSGHLRLKSQPPAMAAMVWVFSVLMVTLMLVGAPNSMIGLRMIVCGLVFLIGAAVFLLATRTEQAELRTKEKLLEIEYRLADLADRLPPAASQ
jgi:hypothetical protein